MTSMPPLEQRLLKFLESLEIRFERQDHAPVFTVEEAQQEVTLNAGARVKNLFAVDKRGTSYLVCVPYEKRPDLAELGRMLGVGRLGMGSTDLLASTLQVRPGSVSLLALLFDENRAVQPLVDAQLWAAQALQFHPMNNAATIAIAQADIARFVQATGHHLRILAVPERTAPPAEPPAS
jgi:Ala-tRNA(Pro) deacylase